MKIDFISHCIVNSEFPLTGPENDRVKRYLYCEDADKKYYFGFANPETEHRLYICAHDKKSSFEKSILSSPSSEWSDFLYFSPSEKVWREYTSRYSVKITNPLTMLLQDLYLEYLE